ncbi:hypothetical protein CI41S_70200 [Bradyrhizobium ivorense]|nr:hypothetical protein CI41S_70200 [Bradyrhizobium ivorense]
MRLNIIGRRTLICGAILIVAAMIARWFGWPGGL